jgi:2-oxoglutarate dehydrogenase E2 component (dihydrolipoamide succinyltransferase)
MSVELKIPEVGESISEVQIGEWLKSEGERVEKDENVAVIETDKATLELPAPVSGTLIRIFKRQGDQASVGDVIGEMAEETTAATAGAEAAQPKPAVMESAAVKAPQSAKPAEPPLPAKAEAAPVKPAEKPRAETRPKREPEQKVQVVERAPSASLPSPPQAEEPSDRRQKEAQVSPQEQQAAPQPALAARGLSDGRQEESVAMSPLRRRIAARLVEAQHAAALLTTFNEIDMSPVIALRRQYQELFQQKYKVRLGFMSFFVKASIEALKQVPQVNAEIRGSNIVYRNYYDIGVAVGGGKGLVVPVLRSTERMSFAEIETAIADFARRAEQNKLTLEELEGGTFTISNGGIYGSLLSTPIINPPQSGILGMHAIQDRPVARDGAVVIRPMMYVALSYDHRIIDGREAVSFLKRVKELIEGPARLLLEV